MTVRDKILNSTRGGYDVFSYYFGEEVKKKVFCNTFRNDARPSCKLYYRNVQDIFYLKDFGDDDWCGDCFSFVGRVINSDSHSTTGFMDICHHIDTLLHLNIFLGNDFTPRKEVNRQLLQNDKTIRAYEADARNFNRYELNYWQQYGITLQTLTDYNVQALHSLILYKSDNGKSKFFSSLQSPMFAYSFAKKGAKIYRPKETSYRFLYCGDIPQPYIFGYDNIKKNNNDFLIITGGEKDVMTLASNGFNAVCFNSEATKVTKDVFHLITKDFKRIVFLYDCDDAGIKYADKRVAECEAIKAAYSEYSNIQITNTRLPLSGTKKDKDASDYFKQGFTSNSLYNLINSNLTV